jgi:flagellar protein FliJ
MTGTRSSRWLPLEKIARAREERQLHELSQRLRALAQHEMRLAELNRYLDEYQRPPARPLAPSLMRNRDDFIGRVREAIAAQRRNVDDARLACAREQERMVDFARETQTMTRLLDTSLAREATAEEARLQAQSDEFAGRRTAQFAGFGDEL